MRASGVVSRDVPASGYVVDDLVIDIGQHRVWRAGTEILLPQLSFDFLVALAKAAPNVVTFDALIDSVWSGAVVSPETVTQRAKLVRQALGDDSQRPKYFGAVRGRGYRVLPSVAPLAGSPSAVRIPNQARASVVGGRRWRLVAFVAAALVIAGSLSIRIEAPTAVQAKPPSASSTDTNTIAVLPFANMSDDPGNDYFSDGLSEELLNRLTLMPELHVAARTSSFHFKHKAQDVKTIGRMLGVGHVLEGSVRKQGERVRVTVQLVNAQNGYRIWSSAFDRPVADVLTIQDEIAMAVAESLKLTLADAGNAASRPPLTRSPEALDLYLRGRHLYLGWQRERIDKGIEHLRQAIRLDPHFVAAYVALAEAIFARAQNTLECCDPSKPWNDERRELLRRAMELDPANADAIASHGLDLMMGREFEEAARALHRAEEINPNGTQVLQYLNFYYHSVGWPAERSIDYARHLFRLDPLNVKAAIGVSSAYWNTHQYENALEFADRAIELDPDAWFAYWLREAALIDLGRYDEAIEVTQKTVALSDGMTDAYADLVIAYAGAGKIDEARKLFDRIDHPHHKPRWRHAFRAQALVGLGEYDEAVNALEQAYREQDGFLHQALHYKIFMPLHEDPRFKELVRLLKQERRVQHTRDKNAGRQAAAVAG